MAQPYIRTKHPLGIDIEMIKSISNFLSSVLRRNGHSYLGGGLFCKTHYAFMVQSKKGQIQFMIEKPNEVDNAYLISWTMALEENFHPIQLIRYENSFQFAQAIWHNIEPIL